MSPQPRKPAGTPAGGQFAPMGRLEASDVELSENQGGEIKQAGPPSKPERVLRELVSEFYRLQAVELLVQTDDTVASVYDHAAEMLQAAITDAFGHDSGRRSSAQTFADVDWTACGNEDESGGAEAQLLGTVWFGSTPFHALALQVEHQDDGRHVVQSALQRDEDLATAANALGDQTPYETVEIDGRPYVVIMSPHAR